MKNTIKINKNQEEKKEHLKKVSQKKLKVRRFNSFMNDKKIKLHRLKECGNFVRFITNKNKKAYKLVGGNFCKNRFCPICSWLKARKTAFKILELLEYIRVKHNKEFIFLTLTAPNVPADKLNDEINDFNKSFKRLSETKDFKACSNGYIRKLEITYNAKKDNYHPHFHCIIAVNKSYFRSRDYISRKKWLEMWKKAKRNENITQVDVRKIEMDTIKEVMEIATYSAKHKDLYASKEIFDIFYWNLKSKKSLVFNGLFRELRKLQDKKELQLDDLENLNSIREKANSEIIYRWEQEKYKEFFERKLTADEIQEFYNYDLSDLEEE